MNAAGEANSYYLTTDVIDALEARVDLYMHNYSEAVTLSQSIIGKYPLETTASGLENMFLNDEGSEVLIRVQISTDDYSDNCENAGYLNWSSSYGTWSPDFVPSQWVIDLYEDSDIRKQAYFLQDTLITNNIQGNDIYMLNKFPGNPSFETIGANLYYNMWKPFRAAEFYLIAAEASYQNNDETTALSMLNDLRTQRGASALSVSGDALFESIKEEWIREYIGEGQRLDGLKRWGDGFTRHDPQNTSILSSGTGMESLSITGDNIRFVWEIPANDQNANENMEPNWN